MMTGWGDGIDDAAVAAATAAAASSIVDEVNVDASSVNRGV